MWILCPQAEEYVVVIPTQYNDLLGWAECVVRFIWVGRRTDKKHIVPVGANIGLAQLVWENPASDRIDRVWLENNHMELDTYWTVN